MFPSSPKYPQGVLSRTERLNDVSSAANRIYGVEGMSCDHCKAAITGEVGRIPGVESVDVDLQTNVVRVSGDGLDDAAIVAAIDEAGYDAVVA
jgi:copper chaperone